MTRTLLASLFFVAALVMFMAAVFLLAQESFAIALVAAGLLQPFVIVAILAAVFVAVPHSRAAFFLARVEPEAMAVLWAVPFVLTLCVRELMRLN